MQMSMDFGGLLNVINPFNWLNYSNQKENQRYQREQDRLNRQMQYDFAQNSIKWRTEDAKRSGIHPLAALGVSPSSASPVYSSSESPRADFGNDLIRAQLDLLRAQTEKTEAEAEVIAGQDATQLDVSKPGGITPSTVKKPEPVARYTETLPDEHAQFSYAIEPSQPEMDKFESLPGKAVEYLRQYHFRSKTQLNRARRPITDYLVQMFKKAGKNFHDEGSLVVRGNVLTGYTLDFVLHKDIDSVVGHHDDKTSAYKKRSRWKLDNEDFIQRTRPKYNW